jgi:hypothetical protein
MGIFNQLNRQIGGDDDEDRGISPLDLRDLPPAMRKVMRMMLREVEMSEASLREAVAGWPAADQITGEELDEALDELVRHGWLIRRGEETVFYEANLRRKTGSELARSVWGNLDSRIAEQRKLREQARQAGDDDATQ